MEEPEIKYNIEIVLNSRLTAVEKGWLYSHLWKWLETQCIHPVRIQTREAGEG